MCMWSHWAATDGITSGNGGTKTAVCVCVDWRAVGQRDRRNETAGVQLLWAISDHKTNRETREVRSVCSLNGVTVKHTNRRTKRLSRMNDKHNTKLAYGYISAGRRDVDRPRERWRKRKPCGCNEHRMAQILLLMTKALI